MTKQKLTMLVGLPASGKSTLIEKMEGDFFVFSSDAYIEEIAAKEGKTYNEVWTPEMASKGFNEMLTRMNKAIKSGKDIIWDQTNLRPKNRKTILRMFSPEKFVRECIVFLPPKTNDELTEHAQRLVSRVGKNIPQSVMTSMRDSFTCPVLEEGFENIKIYNLFGSMIHEESSKEECQN